MVEADIDSSTDADLLEQAVSKLGGLVRRVLARGAASSTRIPGPGRAAGRRMKQLARTLRRRTRGGDGRGGSAHRRGRPHRQAIARSVQAVAGNAGQALVRRPDDGRLGRLVGDVEATIAATGGRRSQTDQRLAGTG